MKATTLTDALGSTRTSFRVAIASRRPLVAAVLAVCAALGTVACGEPDEGVVKAKGSAGGAKGGGKSGAGGTSNGGGGASGGGQAGVVAPSECAEVDYFTATASHVYLGDKTTLRRYPLAGGAKETVDTYMTPASAGGQANIVVAGDDVFYALSSGGHTEIRRVRGGSSSVVFSIERQNESLRTLAIAGTNLYVLTTDGLFAVPIAGGAPVARCASLFGEYRRCPSLVLDGASAYLSCYDHTSPAKQTESLVRCDLEADVATVLGTPAGDVHATPTGYVLNLAVAGDNLVYTTSNGVLDVEVRAIPKAGGTDRLLTTAHGLFPRLASNATTVFFQDGLDPDADLTEVFALTVSDGSKKTLSTHAAFPAGIALVGDSLYAAYVPRDGKLCGVDALQP